MNDRLPPLKTLPVFVTVAKHLSFSKAAEELCLTHSAVSQAIKQLEDFLGCKLFDRTTTQVSLSKIGTNYLADITSAINQIRIATLQTRKTSQWLNINLMNSLALHWLIPKLPDFQQKFPDIKVNLSTSPEPLISGLDTREIDIVIACQKKPLDKSLYPSIKLWEDELVLVAHPNLVNKNLQTLLNKHTALYVDAPIRKNDWSTWCKHYKINEPQKTKRYYFSSTSQALQAAISGMGLFVTHAIFIKDSLDLGLLDTMNLSPVTSNNDYYLVVLTEKMQEPNIKAFIDYFC